MGLQLLKLELRLEKTPSRSFGPVKSAEILWQFCTSYSLRVSLAQDGSWSKWATTQTTNNNSIRSILKKEKLNSSNFLDWYRNLRIVLRNEQKSHLLEEALLEAPLATVAVRNAYTSRVAEQQEVACLMLQQAEQELFETVKAFHACKQEEGQSVSTYVLKMKAYLDQMERLGYPMPLVLGVDLILTSLSKDYDQFVQNYNMHDMGNTIPELHAMLKLAEKSIPKKAPAVLVIRQKIPPPAKKEHPAKDTKCYHYHKTGHWKRNCPLYLVELKKNKASASGTSGYRKLNKRALDLYVSNGNTAAVEAIGSFDLILPSGMILILDNCHFSPTIIRGVISLSRLWDNSFRHKFMDNGAISVSKDNIQQENHAQLGFYFSMTLSSDHINKKRITKLQHDGLLESTDDESFDVCVGYWKS
ncbi:zinc finger, CCHC-type containing protein [Tanacetum coccineum]